MITRKNTKDIDNILSDVKFEFFGLNFKFRVMEKGDGFLIQLMCYMKCNETHTWCWQKGGKYYISSYAINDEIILTAWKACQDFIIHEARETFFYKNQTIFQPHYSVDELAEFCATATLARRPKNYITEHLKDVESAQDIDI